MNPEELPPTELVMAVLERGGYRRLRKPLTVAETEFQFEAAARGTRPSHDLVLVATDQLPIVRLHRLISGLARALDLAGSRRPITLVRLGELSSTEKAELERHARVLHIEAQSPTPEQIERAVAVLLPLDLPNPAVMRGGDPSRAVLTWLAASSANSVTEEHMALVRAATEGAEHVRATLRDYITAGIGRTSQGEVAQNE